MALVTRPVLLPAHAASKKVPQKSAVIVEEKCFSECIYDKEFLTVLFDIYEKGGTVSETHCRKLEKVSNSIASEKESIVVLRTLCALSFLDRYQEKPVIIDVVTKLDNVISNPDWTMFYQLEEECIQLLTRMTTIENLSSLDTDLICLLCILCQRRSDNQSLHDLLFEVGRSVWPYMNRSLWDSEPFVDFISDVLHVVGGKLEQLYPKNFNTAWKVIRANIVGVQATSYSRLRLLSLMDCKYQRWRLPEETSNFYKENYKEFVESKKNQVFSFLGYLPSRRRTSLKLKPGRSAADFLKRRHSSHDNQEKDEPCSSSSNCDGSDELDDVFEEVFEPEDSKVTLDTKDDSASKMDSEILKQDRSCNRKPLKSDTDDCLKETAVSDDNCKVVRSSLQALMKQASSLTHHSSMLQSSQEPQNEAVSNDETVAIEEALSQDSTQDDTTSSETSSNDMNHRSWLFERKKVIVKIPKKYVGRVIGSRGAVIISIQDETSARINFIKDKSSMYRKETIELMEQDDGEKEDFEIIGTDDQIRNAKEKIEHIIKSMEEASSQDKTQDDFASSKTSPNDTNHRGWFFERKKTIVKVPSKYVGRVIGSRGTVIKSIQDESGARVSFLKDKSSVSSEKETTEIPELDDDEKEDFEIIGTDDQTRKAKEIIEHIIKSMEEASSTDRTHDDLASNETSPNDTNHKGGFLERKKMIVKVPSKYVGRVIGSRGTVIISIQDDSGAKVNFLKDKSSVSDEKETTEIPELNDAEKEEDFEIIGTDDEIRNAKEKIEYIIKTAKSIERTKLVRSFSEVSPRQDFKPIYRSLSCPIAWDDAGCAGDCDCCKKGCYCRAFLLSQSSLPSARVRPDDLSITGDADWTRWIVELEPTDFIQRSTRDTTKSCSDVPVLMENVEINHINE